MEEKYIISIDQSTQGTKALLFNKSGKLIFKEYKKHKQIINSKGWVSHNPIEIYENTIFVVKSLLDKSDINKENIVCTAITNQRETALAWYKDTGELIDDAIVWQCNRSRDIVLKDNIKKNSDYIYKNTGLKLSPYFSASKFAWLLENKVIKNKKICLGTMDTWLIYNLTNKEVFKTDFSNASRTQLFNINSLKWDSKILDIFNIEYESLPEVCNSDSCFGYTDFEGILPKKVPINAVLGDSHGALFGQGCLDKGQIKATYGTGSSIMLNIGEEAIFSKSGLVTSLGWSFDNKITYVLEGNLNYTGAIISWLKEDLGLINNVNETEAIANSAIKDDTLYLVPAFSGLGAPYWNNEAKASIVGMTRTTTKAEIVRASLESIAYQISDIIKAMESDTNIDIKSVNVDGGPTRNNYLMQFQSNILNKYLSVPEFEELSGIGVAYMAGIKLKLWNKDIFNLLENKVFSAKMEKSIIERKYLGWKKAVNSVINY